MKVGDLLTDILVIGIPALFWMVLLVSFVAGGPSTLVGLGEWLGDPTHAYLVTLLVPCAYVLGVIVDRASDSLLETVDHHWVRGPTYRAKERQHGPDLPRSAWLRLAVFEHGGLVAEFLQYQRGRIRVARASFVNLFLITLLVLPFLRGALPGKIVLLFLGLGLSFTSLWVWARISRAYYRRLIDAYFLQNPRPARKRSGGKAAGK